MSSPSTVAIRPIGPVSCGTTAWRFRGQVHVTAVVKATFLFVPDAFMRVSSPDEIQAADVHYDGDPRRGVKIPSDLSPYRRKADVLLTGHAYSPAPGGVFASVVRLVVLRGHVLLEKSLQVVGDRTSGAPVKFERLPLHYERSFGGSGWDDNPVGTGLAEGSPPPNLIDPTNERKTVGFGPIARSWSARVRLLGSADRAALERPIAEVPNELDFAYFQDAPEDQQIAYLVGDEWVVLEGLHPSCPVLETQLPGVRAVGKVYGLSQPQERGHPIALNADALHIDADRASCSVTWRASFPVAGEEVLPKIVLVVGVEVAGQPLAWPDPQSLFADDSEKTTVFDVNAAREALASREAAREALDLEGTVELSVMQKSAVLAGARPLPFAGRPKPAPPEATASTPGIRPAPPPTSASTPGIRPAPPLTPASTPVMRPAASLSSLESTLDLPSADRGVLSALPFPGAKPGAAPPPPAPRPASVAPPPAPPPSAGATRQPSPSWHSIETSSALEGTLAMSMEEAQDALKGAPLPFAVAPARAPAAPATPTPPRPPSAPPPRPSAPSRPAPPPRPSAPALAAPAFTSPLEGTLTLTTEEARSAIAGASPLPFGRPPSEPPATALSEPPAIAPSEPPPAAIPTELPPAAPAGPPVDTAKFFHSIPRREAAFEISQRTSDAVPVLYETPAGRVGPLAAFTIPWQIKPPKASLTVGIKATFDIVPGDAAELCPEADMPSGDIFIDGDAQKSLAYASDFTVFKARADVTLTGHAYAPGGSAPMSEVRFHVGSSGKGFERRIAVFGDRLWRSAGGVLSKPTDPVPFKKIALHYENAFGGAGYEPNPVGAGRLPKGALPAGLRMPNLEDPAHLLTNPSETPPPASFAPIPLTWQERSLKAGSYGDKWLKERWPYFPEDMDPAIAQSAPKAQQLEALQGDEPFEIAGMHPKLPVIRGTLPKLRARCFAQKTAEAGGELVEVLLRLDTAHFDADAMKVSLVWRGLIDVSDDDAPEIARMFVITEKLGAPPAPLKAVRARLAEALKQAEEAAAEARGERATPAREALAERLRAEGASPREREAVTARSPAGDKAGTPPAPDADAIAERLRRAGVSENEVSSILAALKGDEPRAPSPSPAKPLAAALAPPPPPNTAALAEELRGAGVGEGEIASLMKSVEEVSRPPQPSAAEGAAARERVIRMLEAGEQFGGIDLAGADLSGLDFSGRSLARANLKEANLRGARFVRADLSAAQVSGADLTDAVLDGANLELADLFGSDLSMASFAGASIARADLSSTKGERASFRGAKGKGARFTGGSFTDARFDEADIEAADFTRAILDGAVFDRASLPEVRLHGARGAKVSFNEARLPGARADGAAFPHGSFRAVVAPGSAWNKAQLDDATWSGASLRGASFFRASCKKANMSACDLADARLDRAKLGGARLVRTNLMTASLQQADLKNADLRWANLYACNTWKAALSGALFDQANLARSTLKARS